MQKTVKYSDPILRNIASEILKLKKTKNIDGWMSIPIEKGILDLRFLFAHMIIITMVWRDNRLNRKIPNKKYVELIDYIVNEIPDSIRWKMGGFEKNTMQEYVSGNIGNLTKDDIKRINIEERRIIGLVAWYDSWKKGSKYSKDLFREISQEVGINDIFYYGKAVMIPNKISSNLKKASKITFKQSQIQKYISKINANIDAFVLNKSDLENIKLKNFGHSFIPVFFEREDGHYNSEFRLMQANKLDSLCYALPKAKSTIIDGAIKGSLYEQFACSILKGDIIIEEEKSDFFTANMYFSKKTQNNNVNTFYKSIKYGNQCGIKLKKRNFPTLTDLIYDLGETDIDILLIKTKDPKHVLLGECNFTKDYNEDEYQTHLIKLKKIYEFLIQNPKSATELGIPSEYPIVPVLLTSFTGDIHKKKDSIGKISFLSLLKGGIESVIDQYLEK
jgi:hypothetical protein